MVHRGDDGRRPAAARRRPGRAATQGERRKPTVRWLSFHLNFFFSMSRRATGPEQTPLHQREAPAGGHAHAEEEPHGCLSAQQLDAGEETLILALLALYGPDTPGNRRSDANK